MNRDIEQNQRKMADAIVLYARERLKQASDGALRILVLGTILDEMGCQLDERLAPWRDRLRVERSASADQTSNTGVYDLVAVVGGDVQEHLSCWKRLLKRNALLLLELAVDETDGAADAAKRMGFRGVTARSERYQGAGPLGRDLIIARSDGWVERLDGGDPHGPQAVSPAPTIVRELPPSAAVRANPDQERIRRDIVALIEGVLQLSAGDLDTGAPFTEVGVDSIISVTLVNQLNERFGTDFQPTVLFDYSTVERLAQHVAGVMPAAPVAEPAAARASPAAAEPMAVPASRENAREAPPVSPESGGNDIAIIGYAGRFPGAADVDRFWENLAAGRNAITEAPAARWDISRFYDPNSNRPDRTNSKWGGFLDGVDCFDPLFFNISGREAEVTDPQHRVFLEEAYHALEHAGYAGPSAAMVDKCGLFVGVEPGDYIHLLTSGAGPGETSPIFQGNAESILAARLCYHLDLKGPAIAINTACSSSLVAIHMACQNLLNGECDMALAGGVRVLATEKAYLALGSMGMLSPDGQCKTFDESANGFVPGEGVGVLVLKPWSSALRDGDAVHAVIRGSAINQDGRTNGITAPSGLSQTRVELEAYARSGISPGSLQYVEAHGTGTRLGDPIEVQALTESFRGYTSSEDFCAIGSVKTNIGHGMAAAGVSAVIKVLLSMRQGQIPPSLNFRQPNSHIDFKRSPFFVNTELCEWPEPHGLPRRAAVSSFGFSGTNSHLVLEQRSASPTPRRVSKPCYLFTLSAKTREGLEQLLARYSVADPKAAAEDVSFTLNVGRGHFEHRCSVLAASLEDFRATVTALAKDGEAANGWLADGGGAPPPDGAIHRQLIEMVLKELPTIQHGDPDRYRDKLAALADLYVKGFDLDWMQLHHGDSQRRVPLPGYPFARERYWISVIPTAAEAPPAVLHPLVHRRLPGSSTVTDFATTFRGSEPFLAGHRIRGGRTLPGVAYLEMALAAHELADREPAVVLSNVAWMRPLVVTGEKQVVVRLTGLERGRRFEILSGDDGTLHADGSILPGANIGERRVDLHSVRARCRHNESGDAIAARCTEAGLELGDEFRGLREVWYADGEALALIELPDAALDGARDFLAHPVLLDGALQATAVLGDGRGAGIPVPFAIDQARLGRLPQRCYGHVRRYAGGRGLLRFGIDLLDESGLVRAELQGVSMRAMATGAEAHMEPVYARPEWIEASVIDDASFPAAGRLLLLDEEEGLGNAFRSAFPEMQVVRVTPGGLYGDSGGVVSIDPDSVDDFERLLEHFPPEAVIHRWGMGTRDVDSAMERGIVALFHLTKALIRCGFDKRLPLLVLHGPDAHPVFPAIAGYAATLRQERPNLVLKTLELETLESDPPDSARLAKELRDGASDHRLRWRNGAREAQRFHPFEPRQHGDLPIREGGVYLITGGLGGLGQVFSRYLAERFRARLALMGRSALGAGQQTAVGELEGLGAEVVYLTGDVTDYGQVVSVVSTVKRRFGALHGIVHAAGMIRDGLLIKKEPEDFKAVLAAKVQGSCVIDEVTREEALDFFVLFSSIAGVFGNIGQADYAYANAFLDEFAHWRGRQQRLGRRTGTTLTIDWPPWAAGGMQTKAAVEDVWTAQGYALVDAHSGYKLFETALRSGESQVLALLGDPDRIRPRPIAAPAPAARVETAAAGAVGNPDLKRDRDRMIAYLKRQFSAQIRIPESRIEERVPLEKYGIDSIMVVEFTQRLEKDFGELSRTLLFEYQNLAELGDYFLASHSRRLAELFPPPPDEPAPRAAMPEPPAEKSKESRVDSVVQASAVPVPNDTDNAEAIAIIGVFGRYPKADNLDKFWEILREGKDCIEEIPAGRWDYRLFFDPEPGREGKTVNKWGGFLDGVENFDPRFFNIMPREAYALDPQERLFLETVWRTVEDAGYRRGALAGRKIGVFVGVMYGQYQLYGAGEIERGRVHPLSSSFASIANRVSYFFDWNGPSIALDTMCSSSLSAIHLACMSLKNGETELAIAGGVNTTLHPHKDMLLSPGGFAASDGRCRSFGEGGDGYVHGEGVGAVLLKPLRRAIDDGDHIHGVIQSTTVNHGGKTNGYTVPNPNAQAGLIYDALASSGLDPRTINYIEAHGTGTSLGDPIEITGLAKAFRRAAGGRELPKNGCAVGSVKSNIGHLESAAGIAGVTKVLLQMRHRQIAPSLHSARLNPSIKFEDSPFFVPQRLQEWAPPEPGAAGRDDGRVQLPLRAGVSSFGAGGANAHVILEEFVPADRAAAPIGTAESPLLFLLSARTEDRLQEQARQLLAYLERWHDHPAPSRLLADAAYTLQIGREAFEERLAFLASDRDGAIQALQRFIDRIPHAETYRGTLRPADVDGQLLLEGEEGHAFLGALARQGKWAKLAELWTSGTEFEWESLYRGADACRVPLPSYPFAGPRFWAPDRFRVSDLSTTVTAQPADSDAGEAQTLLLCPRWISKPIAAATDGTVHGELLLFSSDPTLPSRIRAAYPGLTITRVLPGDRFENHKGTTRIDLGQEAHYEHLVDAVKPRFVFHAWAYDEFEAENRLDAGIYSLFRLCRALIRAGVDSKVRLLFCHPLGEIPAFAGVAAFAKSLAQEQPLLEMQTVRVVQPGVELLAEWCGPAEGVEVRWLDGRREVRVFEPLERGAASETPFRHRGVYLITGGLGGLGRILARHLAGRYNARLLLLGRSAHGPDIDAALKSFEALGGEALYVPCDVGKHGDLVAAVGRARERFGRIHGVFHAAGLIRDAFILQKEMEQFSAVLSPKISGAENLDLATARDELDFFALFSSTAGVFGNAGQADYAFANGYLDAFAALREERRLSGQRKGKTVSVNWPLWEDGGMRIGGEGMTARLRAMGIRAIPSDLGISLLERALQSGETQLIPLWGDRDKLLGLFGTPEATPPTRPSAARGHGAVPPSAQLERYLTEALSAVTGLPIEEIDVEERFESLGVDSIVVNDFNLRLENDLGALSKTLLYEQPNIQKLAEHLHSTYQSQVTAFLGTSPVAEKAEDRAPDAAMEPVRAGSSCWPVPRARDLSREIAIIGLSGRYPGAQSVEAFWDLLSSGADCVTEVPRERWDIDAFYDPDPETAAEGKMYCRWGAFLSEVDRFDPLFFNIAPLEAELMDPQERLFLEVAWHTLEDAGYSRSELGRWIRKEYAANVGVFVGVTSNSYASVGHDAASGLAPPTTLPWSLANRVSYLFNFNGPSLPVDTACSASLTAIHLACEAIRRGECQQAIAGGVNLYLHPSKYSHLCMMKMLSSEGKCRAFGEGGDGFVPGEGVGAILLKPLSLALEDGDHVYALIKGTAVNHGGRTNGYTVPNPESQAEVIASALKSAEIDPRSLGYIEAHGTGTALGDPIEIAGLTKAFASTIGDGTVPSQSCALGSVKTNIGHLESAAGIAGLTKVLLQMRHQTLAPSLHADTPNAKIPFGETPFRVQTCRAPWEEKQIGEERFPRRAGISSFGAGGANAHIVVEEFVAPAPAGLDQESLIVLSAKDGRGLQEVARTYARFLSEAPGATYPLRSIAFTLQVGREALEERAAFVASDRTQLLSGLRSIATGEPDAEVFLGRVKKARVDSGADASTEDAAPMEPGGLAEGARIWVAGGRLEWGKLYRDKPVGRLSLPGYPFARERYWIQPTTGGDEQPRPAPIRLHPLLHSRHAVGAETVYESRFDGSEPVVRDHRIAGRPVLPAAATMEMAWAGFAWFAERPTSRLSNVVWLRPVVADNGVVLHLSIRADDGGTAQIELTDQGGTPLVQCRADASGPRGEPERVDWRAIETRCPHAAETATLYQGFSRRGLDYGEGFRVVRSLAHGAAEFWAELATPSVWEGGYLLHPALLDGALQSLAVIGAGRESMEVPFEVREVVSFRALPLECRAYGRVESETGTMRRYEITLAADDGEVYARLQGVAMRRYGEEERQLFLARPGWRAAPLPDPAERFSGTLLLLDEQSRLHREFAKTGLSVRRAVAGDRYGVTEDRVILRRDRPEDYQRLVNDLRFDAVVHHWSIPGTNLDAALESGIGSLHRLLRALAERRGRDPVPVLYLSEHANPAFDAVAAYARSLRQEESRLLLKTVAVDGPAADIPLLAELADHALQVRYRNGVREEPRLESFAARPDDEYAPEPGSVCLISGGAGALGLVFAAFLLKEFDARVLLVGRSELDQEGAKRVRGLGDNAAYFRADVARADGATAAVQRAKDLYGRLDGVIHAAGVLRDGWVRDKSDADFEAVLAPKIRGARELDAATSSERLHWFVLFSSTAGLLGNAGQGDYAYANAYLDAFARSRNALVQTGERFGRTLSIDWPLWAEGGMPVHREAVELQSSVLGLQPLSRSDGETAFLRALSSGEDQCAVFYGHRDRFLSRIERAIPAPEPAVQALEPSPVGPSASALMEELKQVVGKVLRLDPEALDEDADMAEYGFDSITFTVLSNEVNRAFDLATTPAILFEYETLRSFANFLINEYPANLQSRYAVPPDPPPAAGTAVETPRQDVAPVVPVDQDPGGREPIAVVGMAGVFPGSPDLETFWKNLEEGNDLVTRAATDRWDFGPASIAPWGGWIADADKFDSLFFDISPREAELMDPQQRLFLETVWKTVEDAGYRKTDLAGSRTGLFVGVSANDYANLLSMRGIAVEAYSATGNSHSVLANRVSFLFDLRGPSEAIDTACSSSLVAIHRAVESIESGSSDAAIVGGVNLLASPGAFVAFEKAGMLSEDGRCRSFDARANGYVRGEGVGAILLKPLDRALRDGDSIYGLIRGSAENHGGHVQSLTVPNPNAQAQLLREAFERAGVEPGTISYIEAHGTGTPLGDPIEINGLKKAFADGSDGVSQHRCAVGAVKSNIGHLETAAGIAGVIKVLLAMRNRRIPANVHFRTINPYIKVDGTPFYFPDQTREWEPLWDRDGRPVPLRAGVSSFGFGGANAHLVLEAFAPLDRSVIPDGPELIVLSGRDEGRLNDLASNLLGYLQGHPEAPLPDLAFTLQVGREPMNERLAMVVSSNDDLIERLEAFLNAGGRSARTLRGNASDGRDARELIRQLGDHEELLQPLVRRRDLEGLARLWIAGLEVPWRQLHEGRAVRKLHLPTYPFDRVRHWPDAGPDTSVPAIAPLPSAGNRLHPLVHRNASSLSGLKFQSRFDPGEVLVRDHVVDGRPIMPGAAILEAMLVGARFAGESPSIELRNVVWRRPVVVEDDGVELTLALGRQGPDRFDLELRAADGEIFASATCERADAPDGELLAQQTLDLDSIRSRCPNRVDASRMYEAFAQRGLKYGEGYRVIGELRHGPEEVLGRLEVSGAWDQGEAYVLHPALADGALQSLAFLQSNAAGLSVPFAVDRVTCQSPLPCRCWAYGRLESESGGVRRYSLSLLDDDGRLLASLAGLMVRRFRDQRAQLLFFTPVWSARPNAKVDEIFSGDIILLDEGTAVADELRLIGATVTHVTAGSQYAVNGADVTIRADRPEDYERLLREIRYDAIIRVCPGVAVSLAERLEQGIHTIHRLTRALLKGGGKGSLPLLVTYPPGDPSGEALGGYAKSLRQEQPRLLIKTVAADNPGASLLRELSTTDREVHWRNGQREVRILQEIEPRPGFSWPRGGVCVISGGAGGLGLLFAKYLIQKQDAKVVLAGRSKLVPERQSEVDALGESAVYLECDVSVRAGAQAVIDRARERFGRIDAVIHAAGILRDAFAWNKTEEELSAVLRPKIMGAVALDEATRHEELDCFLMFSSSVGVLGNAGQSDYAFANAWMDAFARTRNRMREQGQRHGRTLSINWPLWEAGGMRGPAKSAPADRLGLLPLDTDIGFEIFEKALACDVSQIWGCLGDRDRIVSALLETPPTRPSGAETASSPAGTMPSSARGELVEYLIGQVSALSKVPAAEINPAEPLEKYGFDSLLAMEFSAELEERHGELSKTLVFEYPTIDLLANYLLEVQQAVPAGAPPGSMQSASKPDASHLTDQPAASADKSPRVSVRRTPRSVPLAPIDYVFVGHDRLAIKVLYYFEEPLDFSALMLGLRTTVDAFFPVNSELVMDHDGNYVIRECLDDPDFEEVSMPRDVGLPDETDLSTLRPFQIDFDPTRRGEKLAKFRLHQLGCGSILNVNLSHAIADGYSFYYFMSAWAAACRGEPFLAPNHSRELLAQAARRAPYSVNGVPQLALLNADVRTITTRMECLTFDGPALVAEAKAVARIGEAEKLTENSVLTATVWKHYAKTMPLSGKELTLACPINFRRNHGSWSHAYFGNASAPAVVERSRDRVLDTSIATLAADITDAVSVCDEKTLIRYNTAIDEIRRTRGSEATNRTMLVDITNGLVVTNVARFPLPPMDFGSGPCKQDFNTVNYAGTGVIVADSGSRLKVRLSYPELQA